MLQRILDEWQGVKFNELIAFCEFAPLAIKILFKLGNFFLGQILFCLQVRMDGVDEEVNSQIKLQFSILSQQIEYREESLLVSSVVGSKQLFVKRLRVFAKTQCCLQFVIQQQF